MVILQHPEIDGRRYLHDNDDKIELFKAQGWTEWQPEPVAEADSEADDKPKAKRSAKQ